MSDKTQQLIKAMEFLKDWSNYLLVTTVAAIGWVSTKEANAWLYTSQILFGLSAVFGILTLAVIPPITERISDSDDSIYDIMIKFNLLYLWPPCVPIQLKMVCWPQHFLFALGVMIYIFAKR